MKLKKGFVRAPSIDIITKDGLKYFGCAICVVKADYQRQSH